MECGGRLENWQLDMSLPFYEKLSGRRETFPTKSTTTTTTTRTTRGCYFHYAEQSKLLERVEIYVSEYYYANGLNSFHLWFMNFSTFICSFVRLYFRRNMCGGCGGDKRWRDPLNPKFLILLLLNFAIYQQQCDCQLLLFSPIWIISRPKVRSKIAAHELLLFSHICI